MKRLSSKNSQNKSLGRPSGIPLTTPPPAPRSRWPRFAAVVFIYGAIGILLLLGFIDALSTAPTDVDNAVDNSPFMTGDAPAIGLTTTPLTSDYVLLQPDRVAVDGERLALELERDRVDAQLAEINARRAQADAQQKAFLDNQYTALLVERGELTLDIERWTAVRDRLVADAEAEALTAALQVTAVAQQAASIRELAEAREAEARAATTASVVTIAGYIVAAVIGTLATAFTLVVVYIGAAATYSRVSWNRPTPLPLPAPAHTAPPTPTTDPALDELYKLMREIERRNMPTAPPQREPVRRRTPPPPVTDEMTRGSHPVSDSVTDEVTDNDEPLLTVGAPLSAADKRRILAAYHRHNAAVTPASRAVFGYANTRTNNIVRAVVEEMAGQGE